MNRIVLFDFGFDMKIRLRCKRESKEFLFVCNKDISKVNICVVKWDCVVLDVVNGLVFFIYLRIMVVILFLKYNWNYNYFSYGYIR